MNQREIFKIITLGDTGVGKTCLICRYCEGRYRGKMTLGVDVQERQATVFNEIVTLQFWDTAGEEKYKQIIVSSYYRGVDGIIFVYDITRQSTLDSIESWMRELENHDLGEKPKILIGNKSDCATDENSVPVSTAEKLATKYDMPLFTTSALLDTENDHVEAIFMTLAKRMFREHKNKKARAQESTTAHKLNLNSENQKIHQKASCMCEGSAPASVSSK